jgi:hypothetical protein
MTKKNSGPVKAAPAWKMFVGHKAKLLGMAKVLALQLCYMAIPTASAQDTLSGAWSINFTSEARVINMTIHLQPGKDGNDNRYFHVAPGELEGLSGQEMLGHNVAVKFRLKREAGVFSCEGTFREGKGSGSFTFFPDPAFTGRMREMGFDNLSPEDQLSMAVQNIGASRVRELKDRKGGQLTSRQLLHIIRYGADEAPMKGFDAPPVESQQTTARPTPGGQTGADRDFSEELEAMGYAPVSPARLNALRENGVTLDFIKGLEAMGYVHPSVEQLISLRASGTTIKYIQEIEATGYPHPSIEQLLALRRSGVSASYIREVESLGYSSPSLDDVAKLRAEGISLASIRSLEAMGYGHPSVSELMSMQLQGVTTDYIKGIRALGYEGLTLKQLVCMRIQGITVDFVKQMRAGGHRVSVRELVKLRNPGTPIEGACGLEMFPDDIPK